MKQDFPVTPVRNSLDRNHSVWTFQPNQVYRLINLIREHEFHVMVSVAGTMADDCGNFVNVDYDDFTVDLQTLSNHGALFVLMGRVEPIRLTLQKSIGMLAKVPTFILSYLFGKRKVY